jgi:parvulin-like peptidyl-prolyl isomerase
VNSGNLPREVKAALDEMREGEISDVIQRGRDYVILKLKGKRGGEVLEYSKVADTIEGMVREEKFKNIIAEYIQRLRDRADIDIHSRAVERIEKKYWQ